MSDAITRTPTSPNTYSESLQPSDAASVSPAKPPEDSSAVCSPDGFAEHELSSPGVSMLVSNDRSMSTLAFLQNQTEAAPTDSNAQRTQATPLQGLYADAGVTSSGDSVYVAAAGLKGNTDGGNFEILTGSLQVGLQTEAQVGLVRAGFSSDSASVEVRTIEAEIHGGVHNPDGSSGINLGGGVSALAVEGTLNYSGNSITGGVSASVSGEVSLGVRDADADGKSEYCARVGLGPVVGGACFELDGIVQAVDELYRGVSSATVE